MITFVLRQSVIFFLQLKGLAREYIYVIRNTDAGLVKMQTALSLCSLTFMYCFFILQQDKWHPLLNNVANVQKYRWLKHSVQGVFSQSSLMATIVEFALKEEPLDVEKMRKCLLKQVCVNNTPSLTS